MSMSRCIGHSCTHRSRPQSRAAPSLTRPTRRQSCGGGGDPPASPRLSFGDRGAVQLGVAEYLKKPVHRRGKLVTQDRGGPENGIADVGDPPGVPISLLIHDIFGV
ncbi:hypothetical protein IOCL2690_000011300 [Leishmania lindenbergi]|uniref:Uncharacterized protein n=1 Tax=Leishmania lindenbergi TaxID=651832 RepID=A0AAW3B092_9TRYP